MYRIFYLLAVSFFFLTVFIPLSRAQEQGFEKFDKFCKDGQSDEGCAVEKLNYGLMPPEQVDETQDAEVNSWLTKLGQTINNYFQSFFEGADNLRDGYLPSPSPEVGDKPVDSLNETLAGPEGYYGATLPLPTQIPEGIEKPPGDAVYIGPIPVPLFAPVNQDEKFYEQSYFPNEICDSSGTCEKICPITGKCAN